MRLQWRYRSSNELDHELIWLAVSVASIAGAAVWLAFALPWPKCAFKTVTGLPCVTCGSTRSLIEFLHGHFLAALKWNPLAFAAICGLVAFDLYAAVVLIGRTARLRIIDWTAGEKTAARCGVIGLLLLNWIYLLLNRI